MATTPSTNSHSASVSSHAPARPVLGHPGSNRLPNPTLLPLMRPSRCRLCQRLDSPARGLESIMSGVEARGEGGVAAPRRPPQRRGRRIAGADARFYVRNGGRTVLDVGSPAFARVSTSATARSMQEHNVACVRIAGRRLEIGAEEQPTASRCKARCLTMPV